MKFNWRIIGQEFFLNLLYWPPYLLSLLIPRDKKIWVFGSWFGNRYSDNARYLFEYVRQNEPAIRAIWLTRNSAVYSELCCRGVEVYLLNSWLGYWLSCRSGVVFVTVGRKDINKIGAAKAKKIQLYHNNISLKKKGYDDKLTMNPNYHPLVKLLLSFWRTIFPFERENWDLIISPSPFMSRRLATAFGVESAKVVTTGTPRVDVLLGTRRKIKVIEQFKKEWSATKVLFYLPTHRGEGRDNFDLLGTLDVQAMNSCLAEIDGIMFIKMHYYHLNNTPLQTLNGTRILFLEEAVMPDVTPALAHADLLITDYSSVGFDYLLLNRPIIYAPFDLERYLSRDRDFYDSYDEMTPGPKCLNWPQVINAIQAVFQEGDFYREKREELLQRLYTYRDTANCARIVETVKTTLNWNKQL